MPPSLSARRSARAARSVVTSSVSARARGSRASASRLNGLSTLPAHSARPKVAAASQRGVDGGGLGVAGSVHCTERPRYVAGRQQRAVSSFAS